MDLVSCKIQDVQTFNTAYNNRWSLYDRVVFVLNLKNTAFKSYGPISCQMCVEMVTRTEKHTL